MNALLKTLNAADESDGIAIVNEFFRFMNRLKDSVGAKTDDELLTAVQGLTSQSNSIRNAFGGTAEPLTAISALRTQNEERGRTLAKIETATGKTGDEAFGVITAWKESHEQLPAVRAEVATVAKATEESTLNTAFAKAKSENKLTPAMEEKFRNQLSDPDEKKRISATGMIALLGSLEPITALVPSSAQPKVIPEGSTNSDSKNQLTLTHNGKTFDQLEPKEQHALWASDEPTFNAMRDEWLDATGR